MYSSPDIAPAAGATAAKKTALPLLAAICCLGFLLFAIAATIILALIPIYTTNRSVPVNNNGFRSKDITMMAEVQANNDASTRRKRLVGDLNNYVGGTFTPSSNDKVKSQLLKVLNKPFVRDVVVLSSSLAYRDTSKKKRSVISKRASYIPHQIVIVIKFYIIYEFTCPSRCQASSGAALRSVLQTAPKNLIFQAIQVLLNGAILEIPQLILVEILYVSEILPFSDPATLGSSPATLAVTTATPAVTQTLG